MNIYTTQLAIKCWERERERERKREMRNKYQLLRILWLKKALMMRNPYQNHPFFSNFSLLQWQLFRIHCVSQFSVYYFGRRGKATGDSTIGDDRWLFSKFEPGFFWPLALPGFVSQRLKYQMIVAVVQLAFSTCRLLKFICNAPKYLYIWINFTNIPWSFWQIHPPYSFINITDLSYF